MRKINILLLIICLAAGSLRAQELDKNVEARLKEFFSSYVSPSARTGKSKLAGYKLDHERKRLDVAASESFAYQPFLPQTVESIYEQLSRVLPGPVNYYTLSITVNNKPIEELIPNIYRKRKKDRSRMPAGEYKGAPWVKNISRPYELSRGLEGKHLSVWQSHGRFYKNDKEEWRWQRPRLFCTTEDLFTQSFVVPYIIPMLENAGAVVFTPRERDVQRHEVVVDNNTPRASSIYLEGESRKAKWFNTGSPGFSPENAILADRENPFLLGTARFTKTEKKKFKAFAEWVPTIPETGRYAVYVSYQTLPGSISDARYTVFHNGGATEFLVNQKIGGGTWVYLGTFEFDQGNNDYGMVVLSNESKQEGVVCADAVRFGGGMGNIARGNGKEGKPGTSGLPRYLEGARYYAQYAGMPYAVYSGKQGCDDYADDINVRSLMTNYLSGESLYNPIEKGLGVPFELSMGVHSDAGYSACDDIIGTLGIYTTESKSGLLNSGMSRYASRDLADIVLTGLQNDIRAQFGAEWTRRSMWDKNYSETRLPAVPSMILEMLSHQNFADMKLGHDPRFKFAVGRSVYKSVLRFVTSQHGAEYVVQPLPVDHFSVAFGKKKNTVRLDWNGVDDPLEPSAKPREYVVYTRVGYGGFDNGVLVKEPYYTREIEPGLVYSFKVTAVNRGGESFPSEILSAYKAKRSRGTVLIVNGFDRLSGPAVVDTPDQAGFDLEQDPGVAYMYNQSVCGVQTGFDRKMAGKETKGGLGYSTGELEGMLIAGNTFDYPFVHGKAIQAAGHYSFVSCSDEAVESGRVKLTGYPVVDYILGLQKSQGRQYKTFSPVMQQLIADYCQKRGSLLVSGSYLGSDLSASPSDRLFAANILKYHFAMSVRDTYSGEITGCNRTFEIPRKINEKTYAVTAPESILAVSPAFPLFAYTDGKRSAGVAYQGDYRCITLGFPFESITSEIERAYVMAAMLNFLGKD